MIRQSQCCRRWKRDLAQVQPVLEGLRLEADRVIEYLPKVNEQARSSLPSPTEGVKRG